MKNRFQSSLPYYVLGLAFTSGLCLWLAFSLLGAMTSLYKRERLQHQALLARNTALQMEADLRNQLLLLNICASRPEFRDAVLSGRSRDALEIARDILNSGGMARQFHLYDASGNLTAGLPATVRSSPAENIRSQPWYAAFAPAREPLIAKISAGDGRASAWTFLEVVPVRDGKGRMLGALTAQIPAQKLLGRLEKLSPDQTGLNYLVNREGTTLADSDGSRDDISPAIWQKTDLVSSIANGGSGALEYEDPYRKGRYLAAYHSLPDLGVSLVREISEENALRGLRLFFIFMGTLALIVAAITGRFFWAWGKVLRTREVRQKSQEVDQLKTDFLTLASHELRTPLTSLREGAALLLDESSENLTDIQHSLVTIIDRNIKRLCGLVNDILDISMLEAGKALFRKDRIAVRPLLVGAVDHILPRAAAKKITLNILIDQPPAVLADPHRVHQVLLNLLSNAVQYTPPGGRVDLSVTTSGPGLTDGRVQFCVADTGMGIPKQHLAGIFEKFHGRRHVTSEEAHGSGLGLAICRQIIEAHGGEIRIESDTGAGTRVYFTLPRFEPAIWWPEAWQQLQRAEDSLGVAVIGLKIEPASEKLLGGLEAKIRQSVKKQDRLLRDDAEGLVWVLASAAPKDAERIANRLLAALQAYLAENRLVSQVQLRIASEHAAPDVLEPGLVTQRLLVRLKGESLEKTADHR